MDDEHGFLVNLIIKVLYYFKFWGRSSVYDSICSGIMFACVFGSNSFFIGSEIVALKNNENFADFATQLSPICFHLAGFSKGILILWHLDAIEKLLEQSKLCHRLCLKTYKTDNERDSCIDDRTKFTKIISKYALMWILFVVYVVVEWCLNPIIYNTYIVICHGYSTEILTFTYVPYEASYPWKTDNIAKYSLVILYQLINTTAVAIEISFCDSLIVLFLANICFNIYCANNLLTGDTKDKQILRSEIDEAEFNRKLKNWVEFHRELLEYIDRVAIIFNTPLLVQCIDVTSALLLVSLAASIIDLDISSIDSFMKLFSMVEYWVGLNIELFFICLLATKAEELGLQTSDAIYLSNWEKAICNSDELENNNMKKVTKIKQDVKFIIMRTQKPIVFKGGLFYTLSLTTFKALFGFCVSNALILRQMSSY